MKAITADTRRGASNGQTSRREARRAQAQSAARQRRLVIFAGTAIVLVLGVLVGVRLATSGSSATPASGPASASVVDAVTRVDQSMFDLIARGTAAQLPTPVRGQPAVGSNSLPVVTYIGAEYCPFCAGERWPLIVALSRFGTFSGLQLSHSASDDIYPNTPTFSFVGSTYTSPYLEFDPVELQSNVRSGNSYQQLQTPTPAQTSLLQTYDRPPYVPASAAGSIPFIDIGDQYLVSGASYDIGTLRGMTPDQVATTLSNPSSSQAQAIVGAANTLTAAICTSTGNMPADVCSAPAVASLQATLAATPAPARG
jgi:hypothetical protein